MVELVRVLPRIACRFLLAALWWAWLSLGVVQAQTQIVTILDQPASPTSTSASVYLAANATPGEYGRITFWSGTRQLAVTQVAVMDVFGPCDAEVSRVSQPKPLAKSGQLNAQQCVIGSSGFGSVALPAGTFTPGTYLIHGTLANYAGTILSTSANVTLIVNSSTRVPTTLQLTSSVNPSAINQLTTLTAGVVPNSASGTVTFKDGATTLGNVALTTGFANFSGAFAATGAHNLTAVYSGDTSNLPSTSSILVQTVNATATLPQPPSSPIPVAAFEYDALGNSTKTIQAPGEVGFGFATQSTYDALNRRKNMIDARAGLTQFAYDGKDSLTKVTDPRNLVTLYSRNGLGDVTAVVSPDTGSATHSYDAAGNLTSRTDSRGALATHTYDAINRLTSTVFSKTSQTSLSYIWNYDQTGTGFANGIGRLTSTSHPAGSTQHTYDAQGRLLNDTQRVSSIGGANSVQVTTNVVYTYDGAGNVASITYPSGRVVNFAYSGGLPSAVALAKDGATLPVSLIEQIQFSPFGLLQSMNLSLTAGPQTYSRVFDLSGRLVRYRLGSYIRDITYDRADRIGAYTHYDSANNAATALDQTFSYDELGRLVGVTVGGSTWSITYDANGNRTGVTLNGAVRAYNTETTSNRLTGLSNPVRNFGYDSAGNTTGDSASYTSTYNLAGRLTTLIKGSVTTTYSHDGMGRRVRKFSNSGASSTVIFVYDQSGQMLGEYDSTGKPVREYVWLGNTLISIFTPDPASATSPPLVYFVHSDHLNAPRVVVDKANNVRWRWMAEPFGVSAPETNPSGLGAFTLNLRLPGQHFDQESALHYNYFRNYDPSLGRYVQSDPIGLAGGINTYSYVGGNPLSYSDPNGLQAIPLPIPIPGVPNPSADAQQQLAQQLADALRRNFPQKTYQTYTRYNPKTGKCYSGRTSGYDDPLTNIRNRGLGQPSLNAEKFLPPVLDRSSTNKGSIRGREQQLIDINGGAQSVGGTSRNMINGISPINPFGNGYLDEATDEFGRPVPAGNCTCQ